MTLEYDQLPERIYRDLQDQIRAMKIRVSEVALRSERAELAGGVPASTLANAPTGAGTATDGVSLLWISNGRKAGEGAGAGTGVLAYFNPSTGTWFRSSDDTAVVV